jgi:hypothetical protein
MRKVLIVGLLLCGGCATTAKYDAFLASWLGKNMDDYILNYGPPARVTELHNGNKLYSYRWAQFHVQPVSYSTFGDSHWAQTTATGGGTSQYWCETSFEVSGAGKILRYSYRGNTCRMF